MAVPKERREKGCSPHGPLRRLELLGFLREGISRIRRRRERPLVKGAAHVLTVSRALAEVKRREHDLRDPLIVLTDGYDAEDVDGVAPMGCDRFALVYAGSLRPPDRVMTPLLQCVSRLRQRPGGEPLARLHHSGHQGGQALSGANHTGAGPFVEVHESVPRAVASSSVKGASAVAVICSVLDVGPRETAAIVTRKLVEESAPNNERPHAGLVLERIPVRGVRVFPSIHDLDHHLETVVWHHDEPFGDLSILAQWCLMREIGAQGLGVVLDGQGADEILGGYGPYLTHVAELARGCLRCALRDVMALRTLRRVSAAGTIALALVRQLPAGLQSLLRRRQCSRLQISLLAPEYRALVDTGVEPCYGFAEDQRSISQHLRFQVEEGVLPTLLRYEGRNTSAFGFEGRVPFLDHRLVEFAFSKGARFRLRDGWTKWSLRKAFADDLPGAVAWRRNKVGFGVPGVR